MRTRIRAIAVAMSAVTGVLFAVAASGPASGHGGNPDMLPAGSYACTRWVQSSQGAYISGMTNSPAAGTFFLRNCVEATNGPLYWFRLQVESAVRPSIGHGPLQARLGPGGRHCGFSVDGPTIGLGDGAARLTATSTVPVRFSIIGMNEDYASLGPVFSVTATSVDRVFTPASNVSETSACAENTSNAVAVVSFSLSPA
jgi:hypothetical protein